MQKYNKNSAGEQSVKEFFLFDSDDLFFVKAFSVDYSECDKFYFELFCYVGICDYFCQNSVKWCPPRSLIVGGLLA